MNFGAIAGGLAGGLPGAALGMGNGNGSPLHSVSDFFTGGDAQQRAAEQQLQAERERTAAAMAAAAPTSDELSTQHQQQALYDKMLTQMQSGIDRSRDMLDAVNPGLAEAGKQAYQLLQGQNAAILKPLQEAQQRQTDATKAQLAEGMGSGYATSSAGAQAMANLGFQQNQQLQGAQQASLGMLLNSSQATAGQNALSPQLAQMGSSLGQINGSLLNDMNSIQGRQVMAANGSKVPDYAGANQLSDVVNKQWAGGLLNSFIKGGAQMQGAGGAGAGAGAGAAMV